MKKKFLFITIILFLINNCGFTPKYAGYQGRINYELILNKISGDRELNNYIKSQLSRYKKSNTDLEIINIDLESIFTKEAIAKDTEGKITKYNLKALVNVTLRSEDQTRQLSLEEQFKIDKIEDSVEENNYILIVKKDFAQRIINNLIFNIRTNFKNK